MLRKYWLFTVYCWKVIQLQRLEDEADSLVVDVGAGKSSVRCNWRRDLPEDDEQHDWHGQTSTAHAPADHQYSSQCLQHRAHY